MTEVKTELTFDWQRRETYLMSPVAGSRPVTWSEVPDGKVTLCPHVERTAARKNGDYMTVSGEHAEEVAGEGAEDLNLAIPTFKQKMTSFG